MVRATAYSVAGHAIPILHCEERKLRGNDDGHPAVSNRVLIRSAGDRSLPRVVLVDLGVSFGGAVVSGSLLAREVAAHGCEVILVTALDPEEVKRLVGPDVDVVRLRQAVSYFELSKLLERVRPEGPSWLRRLVGYAAVAYQLLANLPWSWRLARLCRDSGANILHANNGQNLSTTLASILSGTVLVVHLRGPYGRPRLTRPTERRAARFVAISDFVRDTALAAGLDPERVATLYNPVELPMSNPSRVQDVRRSLGGIEGGILVGSVGRIVRWKGQREFLEALAPLFQEFPALRAVIVGDGADGGEDYLEELQAWVEDQHLVGRVRFSGFRRDVNEVFAALDLFVHSATEPEPFGRVIVEAMAQGTPVLAANAGGPLEIIRDGEDGLLRDPRDLDAVRQAIREIILDPGEARRIGQAGRETALARFSLQGYGRAMCRLYDEVLRETRARLPGSDG